MCDNPRSEAPRNAYDNENKKAYTLNPQRLDSDAINELNRKREYHLRKLVEIQAAIDAVMRVDY